LDPAAVNSQFQNPVEREVQTVNKGVATLFADQHLLTPSFWPFAVQSWIQTANASPISGDMSPLQIVTNIVPDISTSFRFPFGCPVTSSKEEPKVSLTQAKSEIGIALGTSPGSNKSVIIYIPGRGIKLFNRLNVQYLHINFQPLKDSSSFTPIYDDSLNVAFTSPVTSDVKIMGTSGFNFFLPILEDIPHPTIPSNDLTHTITQTVFSVINRTADNPALASALRNWTRWSIPSDKELDTIDELGCFEHVLRHQVPHGVQILPTKMDFKTKFDSLGEWLKDKARLVVLGNLEYDYVGLLLPYCTLSNTSSSPCLGRSVSDVTQGFRHLWCLPYCRH
jgi:hypothetical protein